MKWMVALAPVLLIALAAAADEKEEPMDPLELRAIPEELSAQATSAVESSNRFAFDLYGAVKGQEGNLFLSPYSISTALAMTYAGAAGATEREMADVLRFSLEDDRLHQGCGAVISSLNRGSEMEGYELVVANALWPQTGFDFLETYLSIPGDHYDAMFEPLDYRADAEAARLRINSWVEETTKERITDLMPPGSVDDMTRLVLTNAIYFKGRWAIPFSPDRTRIGGFRLEDGTAVDVPMMHQDGIFHLGHVEGLSLLEIPYEGEDLSMLILLPDAVDGLSELEYNLTHDDVANWILSLHETQVDVTLPKFTMTSPFDLKEVLAGMGMPSAFQSGAADFSKMTGGRDLFIGAAVHKAFVDVNEEGTEAAAATGIGMVLTSMRPSRFVADHPFLFLIRDEVTGGILFMGRVTDPTS
jgi:serpin B